MQSRENKNSKLWGLAGLALIGVLQTSCEDSMQPIGPNAWQYQVQNPYTGQVETRYNIQAIKTSNGDQVFQIPREQGIQRIMKNSISEVLGGNPNTMPDIRLYIIHSNGAGRIEYYPEKDNELDTKKIENENTPRLIWK